MAGLLGVKQSRQFKIYRLDPPAIFRFNGKLYKEFYDIDMDKNFWVEIKEEDAEHLLHVNGH
jgi:hypothetical protein